MEKPVLSNGSEAWIIRQQYERCLSSAEVSFLRKTACSSLWDRKKKKKYISNRIHLNNTQSRIPPKNIEEIGCSI
jgi:hypothetical protein